jgi:predicted ATPase
MLTKLKIRNFKRFENVEIELGNPVVFIGPNNSGKTTALQALALWEVGLRKWNEKRAGKEAPEKRPGVTINRKDLIAVPVPYANLLWRDLHSRDVQQNGGKPVTKNIRIEIVVDGVTEDKAWSCGLEFDYANEESFYCRPLRVSDDKNPERMPVPILANSTRIAFLPPMSGLAAVERRLDPGAINVLIGEGRTAEVLRNLSYAIAEYLPEERAWQKLVGRIQALFGITLNRPEYIDERGEIQMTYREQDGPQLDLSSSGRGLQQTLMLMAYLQANPGAILLLDEPDAHLEILRQRQIYQLLTDLARESGSQIIAASHSEIILNEAADRDVVVAFVGKPHRIDDRGSQVLKALKEIGFEQYYQAEQKGWVLYLEGATDLAILRVFAETLEHPAYDSLEQVFVHYVQNQPSKAQGHFRGLREGKSDLVGFALFDRLQKPPESTPELEMSMWQRREIENYLTYEEVLMLYAENSAKAEDPGPLFSGAHIAERKLAMKQSIDEVAKALTTLQKGSPWSPDTKASDFLDPLFAAYFKKLGLPDIMRKTNYHELARLVPKNMISGEVIAVLDGIVSTAKRARPKS